MKQALKEKLVGSIIIVTAIVLVLPSIVGNPPYEPDFKVPSIPPVPAELQSLNTASETEGATGERVNALQHLVVQVQQEREAYVASEPPSPIEPDGDEVDGRSDSVMHDGQAEQLVAQIAKAKHIIRPAPEKPLQALKEREQLSADLEVSPGLKPAWTVQVASFRKAVNAEQLKAELLLKGYRAYRESVQIIHNDPLHRVYIGPDLLRSQAERVAFDVKGTFGMEALIVRYKP